MARLVSDGELKALWTQLVGKVGGQEAAAVHLGVSRQRVQQIGSPNCPDMPTFRQIICLECVCETAVVTGACARAIEGETSPEVATAAVEAVTKTAGALRLVHTMDADGRRDAAEIRDAQRATQEAVEAAEALRDAAAQLTPGRVA